MTTVKGRGKGQPNLTAEEKKFIENHFDKDGWTDQKIAEKLGRNPETVARYRKKNLLVKKFVDNKTTQVSEEEGDILTKDAKEQGRLNFWKAHFRGTHRYNTLKSKLQKGDLDFFLEKWAVYHIQFEDMTATEEDNIEQLILLELRMKDNLKARKDCQDYEMDLQRQIAAIGVPHLDVEIEQQRRLHETIISNNKMLMELNKEYREMFDRYEKAMRSMNATREQREAKQQIGGDTFLSLVRLLQDKQKREEVGKYNEYMRMSGQKKLEEFKKPHMFADNGVEPIIMMGKDYVKEDNGKKDSTSNGG